MIEMDSCQMVSTPYAGICSSRRKGWFLRWNERGSLNPLRGESAPRGQIRLSQYSLAEASQPPTRGICSSRLTEDRMPASPPCSLNPLRGESAPRGDIKTSKPKPARQVSTPYAGNLLLEDLPKEIHHVLHCRSQPPTRGICSSRRPLM